MAATPLLALDPHAHALARRGQRDEGGAAVAGALGAGGIALPADGVTPHGQPVDLDGDLPTIAPVHVSYGKGCADRPRARLKSKEPSSVPPMLGAVGGVPPVLTAVTYRGSPMTTWKLALRRSPKLITKS